MQYLGKGRVTARRFSAACSFAFFHVTAAYAAGSCPAGSVPTVTSVVHPVTHVMTSQFACTYIGSTGGGMLGGGSGGGSGGGGRTRSVAMTDGQGRGFQGNRGVLSAGLIEPTCGNPTVLATGNKVEEENDFLGVGEMPLELKRSYNHRWTGVGVFGRLWTSSLDYKLTFGGTTINSCYPRPGGGSCGMADGVMSIFAWRPDGRTIRYDKNVTDGIFYETKPNPVSRIVKQVNGSFVLYGEENEVETYSSSGYVNSVRNGQGIGWIFSYTGTTYPHRVTHTSGQYIEITWSNGQATAIRDPAGNYYGYAYSANLFGPGQHRLASTSRPGTPAATTTYHYESADATALTGKTFGSTRYSTFSYDAKGRVASTEHYGGIDKYQFSYTGTSVDFTTTVTNPLGKKSSYNFKSGKLSSISGETSTYCPLNTAVLTEYDTNGNPAMKSDAKGNNTAYTYNAKGQLTQLVEAYGTARARTTNYTWSTQYNRLLAVEVAGVSRTEYEYTGDNRISKISLTNLLAPSPATNLGQVRTTTFSYSKHSNGLVSSMVIDGPLAGTGDKTTVNYDTNGNVTSVANGKGQASTYTGFNGLGLAASAVGPNGDRISYEYDERGYKSKITAYPDGITASSIKLFFFRDSLQTRTLPDGTKQSFEYGLNQRLLAITSSESSARYPAASSEYQYDLAGNVTARLYTRTRMIGQNPKTTKLTAYSTFIDYDELGRPRARRGNSGQAWTYTYDANGNISSIRDVSGRTTTFEYDALNQLKSSKDAAGGTTSYGYDKAGRLTSVSDTRGRMTSYVYDGFGQVWKMTSPDTGTTSYTYDTAGRRLSMTRSDGTVTSYSYDDLDRLIEARVGAVFRRYSYDVCTNGVGRLCVMSDSNGGSTEFGYMPDGRISSRRDRIAGVDGVSDDQTNYYYDSIGRLSAITYPDGMAVGYGYAFGRLKTMTVNIGGAVTTVFTEKQYAPMGPPRTWSLGNGLVSSASADSDGRITSITAKNGTTELQSLAYTYTPTNQVRSVANAATPSLSQVFGYDALERLTSVVASGADQVLTYDANGNRQSHVWASEVDKYAISGTGNRIDSISGSRARTLSYDPNGYLKTNGTASYTYDAFGNLATHALAGVTSRYGTNALGQRTSKSKPGFMARYIYMNQNQLLSEVTSGVRTNYLWLNGQLIGIVRNNQIYYVHTDHLGRPELATNSSKAVVWRASNFAFTRVVTQDSIGGLNIGFPGQYFDSESSLWYVGRRHYDAGLGRFLQSDPSGLEDGTNPYAYVSNNPINAVDAAGLQKVSVDFFLFGAGGGVDVYFDYKSGDFSINGIGLRGGFGDGASISYDPTGERPDKVLIRDCEDRLMNSSLGLYGSMNVGIPAMNVGGDIHAGFRTNNTSGYQKEPQPLFRPYFTPSGPSPNFGLSGKQVFGATASVGVEGIIY